MRIRGSVSENTKTTKPHPIYSLFAITCAFFSCARGDGKVVWSMGLAQNAGRRVARGGGGVLGAKGLLWGEGRGDLGRPE